MLIFCLPTGTLFPVSSKKQMDFWLSDLLLLTPYYICAKEHSDLLKKGYFRTLVKREKGDQQTWDTSSRNFPNAYCLHPEKALLAWFVRLSRSDRATSKSWIFIEHWHWATPAETRLSVMSLAQQISAWITEAGCSILGWIWEPPKKNNKHKDVTIPCNKVPWRKPMSNARNFMQDQIAHSSVIKLGQNWEELG